MGKFWGWLAGVAATVIAGYLTWYFTRPPAPPVVTTFEGMVYSGSKPVPGAMVAVALTGSAGANGPYHNVTDQNGAYMIDLSGVPANTAATLSVSAAGYAGAQPKQVASPLQNDERIDFPLAALIPIPVQSSHGSGAKAPSAPPAKPPVPHVPVYVRKTDDQAAKFAVPAK